MNTDRSAAMLARNKESNLGSTRRVARYSQAISGSREEIFPLLCPTREADWIPGWDAGLLFTESGFAEEGCVFETGPEAKTGAGLWVFTRHEGPEVIEILRFSPPVLIRIRISLEEEAQDRTVVHWEYVMTGLTDEGNQKVEEAAGGLPENMRGLTAALDHYSRTGELVGE